MSCLGFPCIPTIFWYRSVPSFEDEPRSAPAVLDQLYGTWMLHVLCALPVNLQDLVSHLKEGWVIFTGVGVRGGEQRCNEADSYPHLAVSDSSTVLGQSQHIQVHVVLTSSPQAETKTFGVPLQVHWVELRLLRKRPGQTNPQCTRESKGEPKFQD